MLPRRMISEKIGSADRGLCHGKLSYTTSDKPHHTNLLELAYFDALSSHSAPTSDLLHNRMLMHGCVSIGQDIDSSNARSPPIADARTQTNSH